METREHRAIQLSAEVQTCLQKRSSSCNCKRRCTENYSYSRQSVKILCVEALFSVFPFCVCSCKLQGSVKIHIYFYESVKNANSFRYRMKQPEVNTAIFTKVLKPTVIIYSFSYKSANNDCYLHNINATETFPDYSCTQSWI